MSELLQISNKDGETIASALGILKDLNSNNTLSNIEQEIASSLPDKIRIGIMESQKTASILNKTSDINQKISILDKYIEYIKDIINVFNQNNDDYMNYILSKYKNNSSIISNINTLFQTENGLNLLAINKTALSAFNTLRQRVKNLENIKKQIQSGDLNGTVEYKGKKISYSSFIYPMHYLFSDILGGIGEGVGALFALQELEKFLRTIENDKMKVSFEGTGTQQINGTTKKGDYEISINSQDGIINLTFGISAKAQSLHKGKKVTTTFQTSKLGVFVNQINNLEKYIFYNNLYHNTDNGKNGFSYYIRRKISAQNFLNATTGLNQGENVLFIQYLDDLIRIDEFFEELATTTPDKLPGLSIQGIASSRVEYKGQQLKKIFNTESGFEDLTVKDKNVMAFVRSRQVIKNLNNLITQIQYEH
ncbi:MAG: hypothetical protein ACI4PE_03175 [Bacilli bacterium]